MPWDTAGTPRGNRVPDYISDWQGLWEGSRPSLFVPPTPTSASGEQKSARPGAQGRASRLSACRGESRVREPVGVPSPARGKRSASGAAGACVSGSLSQRGAVAIAGRLSSKPVWSWRLVQLRGPSRWASLAQAARPSSPRPA